MERGLNSYDGAKRRVKTVVTAHKNVPASLFGRNSVPLLNSSASSSIRQPGEAPAPFFSSLSLLILHRKRHFLQTETADLPQFSISPVLHIHWNICVQAKHRGHSEHYVCRALELQALISVWCMYAAPKTINTCDSL